MRRLLALALLLLLMPVASAEDPPKGRKLNRLAKERSPYLRQHAANPVDWYPWGPAAFAKAKEADKPILLSIGYAACHWCHVMERESFEDVRTARVLNRVFVCVKVDREERPDIDSIYMNAVYALGKRGGWPMTVVLTPDAKPFWAGTYLPPQMLRSTAESLERRWRNERQATLKLAERVAAQVRSMSTAPKLGGTRLTDTQIIERARGYIDSRYDARYGGYAAKKKFPPHAKLLWALEDRGAHATDVELRNARGTLSAMGSGGFHDHLGGGFHRYTVDEVWFLPHFEKILYDNALLIPAYSARSARTTSTVFRLFASETLTWLEREMRRPKGGYASSLDADTKGHEGLTYTWTTREISAVLPGRDGQEAARYFNATERGNFKDERTGRRTGRNVLFVRLGPDYGHRPDPMTAILSLRYGEYRKRLLAARMKRAQPRLDDKVITSWNGLLISAFARAAGDLDEPVLLERGKALADYLLSACRAEDGALLRFPKDSGAPIRGFCEDYAHLANGLLDLAKATGEAKYATAATDLGRRLMRGFEDTSNGGFFSTSHRGHETLIARGKEFQDSPIPSDNGVATIVCLRLWAHTGDAAFRQAADRALALYRPLLAQPRNTFAMVTLLQALRMRARTEAEVGPQEKAPAIDVRQGVARIRVYLGKKNPEPGEPVGIRVDIDLDADWHVNANPASAKHLIPTELTAPAGSGGVKIESVNYPEATRLRLGNGPEMTRVYEKRFAIEAIVRAPESGSDDGLPSLTLRFQPCTMQTCREAQSVRLVLPWGGR